MKLVRGSLDGGDVANGRPSFETTAECKRSQKSANGHRAWLNVEYSWVVFSAAMRTTKPFLQPSVGLVGRWFMTWVWEVNHGKTLETEHRMNLPSTTSFKSGLSLKKPISWDVLNTLVQAVCW